MVLSETTCWEAGPGAAGCTHPISSIGSYESNFTGALPADKAGQDQSLTDPSVHAGKIKSGLRCHVELAGVRQGARKLPSDASSLCFIYELGKATGQTTGQKGIGKLSAVQTGA
ncbi:hypothetical protein HispidOSU_023503 [Sigmodon hispidus]